MFSLREGSMLFRVRPEFNPDHDRDNGIMPHRMDEEL